MTPPPETFGVRSLTVLGQTVPIGVSFWDTFPMPEAMPSHRAYQWATALVSVDGAQAGATTGEPPKFLSAWQNGIAPAVQRVIGHQQHECPVIAGSNPAALTTLAPRRFKDWQLFRLPAHHAPGSKNGWRFARPILKSSCRENSTVGALPASARQAVRFHGKVIKGWSKAKRKAERRIQQERLKYVYIKIQMREVR